MANTYRKMCPQTVFAVKGRQSLPYKKWRRPVFEYIAGILNQAVNGYNDHIHIFFDYSGKELVEVLVREIKKASNKYISDNNFLKGKFKWQTGFSFFFARFQRNGCYY